MPVPRHPFQEDHPGAEPRAAQRVVQRRQLLAPADERQQVPVPQPRRHLAVRVPVAALPAQLADLQRLAEPLGGHRPEVLELVLTPPLREPPNQVGAQHLAAVGHVDQARGLDDRQAAHVVIRPAHVARAERGPDGHRRHRVLVLALHRLLDRGACLERGRGRGEQGHEPVAEALDEDRPVRGGDGAQQLLVPPEVVVGQFLAEAGARAGRADDVGEQHGGRGQRAGRPGRHDGLRRAPRSLSRRTPVRAVCLALRRSWRTSPRTLVFLIPQRRASSGGTRNGACPLA